MTWRDKIYTLIKATMYADANANDASDETLEQLESQATDIADAVANSVHDDLLSGMDSELASFLAVLSALSGLMSAMASESQLTTSKAAATAVGNAIPGLTGAISTLRDKIASFK